MSRRRLIFSSGGQWGASFIGAVRALESHYGCRTLSEYYSSFEGTSAGAVCALFLALGFSSLDLLLAYTGIPEYRPEFSRLATNYGLQCPLAYAGPILRAALTQAGLGEQTTFQQLKDAGHPNLVCGLTVLGPSGVQQDVDASVETTPNWPVLATVIASMAIPVVFDFVTIRPAGSTELVYAIDGAITNGFRFPRTVNPDEEVLGILLCPEQSAVPEVSGPAVPAEAFFSPGSHTIFDYLLLVWGKFFHYLSLMRTSEYKNANVIAIPCVHASSATHLQELIAKPSREDLQRYLRVGEQTARAFLADSSSLTRTLDAAAKS